LLSYRTLSFKYKNAQVSNVSVALVIDDLASEQPWQARGLKIQGTTEIVERNGRFTVTVHPQRLWSRGLEGDSFKDGKPVCRTATFA